MARRAKARILIVDDDAIGLQLLAQALSDDYKVMVTQSGEQAIAITQAQQPDLVLLDINLPDIDGYKICKTLKNNPATKSIPLIFVTGFDSDDEEVTGLKMGAADYLTKPFHIPLVKARVAIQVELKRKTDLLEKLVDLDGLTGIPNRRRFDIKFDEEWRRLARRGESLSLCLMDVDFFKQYNDNYGHAQGDECLRKIAHELDITAQRAGDFVARYGGEEFVMILPTTDLENATLVVNKMQNRVTQLKLTHGFSSCSEQVTLSYGIATAIPHRGCDKNALLVMADEQLYAAKSDGRNRICGAELDVLT